MSTSIFEGRDTGRPRGFGSDEHPPSGAQTIPNLARQLAMTARPREPAQDGDAAPDLGEHARAELGLHRGWHEVTWNRRWISGLPTLAMGGHCSRIAGRNR